MRCKIDDKDHREFILKMWHGHQLAIEDLKRYRFFSSEDIKQNKDWEFANVLVTGNKERQTIIASQAKRFAIKHKTHLIRWPLKVTYVRGDENESGRQHREDPSLWGYFVCGGPANLTANINPTLQLANGTPVELHSLYFNDKCIQQELDHKLGSTPIGATITLSEMPTAIIVKVLSHEGPWIYDNVSTNKKDSCSCDS